MLDSIKSLFGFHDSYIKIQYFDPKDGEGNWITIEDVEREKGEKYWDDAFSLAKEKGIALYATGKYPRYHWVMGKYINLDDPVEFEKNRSGYFYDQIDGVAVRILVGNFPATSRNISKGVCVVWGIDAVCAEYNL